MMRNYPPRDEKHVEYIKYWHNQPEPPQEDVYRWFAYHFYRLNYKPIDNINEIQ